MVGREVDGQHIFFVCFRLSNQLMVRLEADRSLWVVLVRSGDLGRRSQAALGASVYGLRLLSQPLSAVLGRSRDLCRRSSVGLAPYVGLGLL